MASSHPDSNISSKVPSQADVESRDRQIRATIYGQCIGDAVGLLTEFMTKKEAKTYYKEKQLEYSMKVEDFHRSRWKTGDWTDDSDQMIMFMLAVMQDKGQVIVKTLAQKLKGWMQRGIPDLGDFAGMGLGATTSAVLKHPNYIEDPHKIAYECWENSGRNIAPNGGVMRTSVVGTHCWWDVNKVAENALSYVLCTHHDPRCQASAVAVSTCISLMLQRQPQHLDKKGNYNVDALIKDSFHIASQRLEKQEDKKLLWKFMSCKNIKDLDLAEAGKIGYTYKSMGSGFWGLKQDDFRAAIQKIVMQGGDADSNACVAGALLGCKLGLEKIPESWINGLQHKDWLDNHLANWLAMQKEMAQQGSQIEKPTEQTS